MNSSKIVNVGTPTANLDAANKSYVDTSIPIGGIIMWSGLITANFPSNWKLCDGENGTPDLRGRFILCAGQGTSLTNRLIRATGGAETVALTEAQMPKHTHGVTATTSGTDGDHSHTVNDPEHQHTQTGGGHTYPGTNSAPIAAYTSQIFGNTNYQPLTSKVGTGISIKNYPYPYPSYPLGTQHKHTITVTETDKGSGTAHENMPPFYVLAFIMRIS